ncbi:hypothetical protein L1049_001509 [Liquidambar formosana]|uniref:Uncharacterized protein n=1 Tax=Liquidambar formosana TaxID=63359 RepID=A0AAP0R8D4_LIQFO
MASKPFLAYLPLFLFFQLHTSNAQAWIQSGYWYFGGEFAVGDVNSALFTHLICGFAIVDNSTYRLSISSSDATIFSTFTRTVKRKNPSIVTLLSVWPGLAELTQSFHAQIPNSTVLSLMVSKASHRKSFIQSSIKTARLYGFHGLDLFWVWPSTGFDLINLGSLLDEWRAAINSESRNSNQSRLILTMGLHYVPVLHSVSYPVDSIGRNLDWAHVIAYGYYVSSRVNFTRPSAALYDPWSNVSTNFGIGEWTRQGLPASKLLLGLPFHGHAWKLKNPNDNGLGAPASGSGTMSDGCMGYKFIMSNIRGYGKAVAIMYNGTYVVNYCTLGTDWIGYDDVEAIRSKVSYAKEKKLLGYNAFLVSNDENWVLSRAAAQKDFEDRQYKPRLAVIVVLPVAMVIFVLGFVMCYLQRRILKSILGGVKATESLNCNAPNLEVFSFADIVAATNNFSIENKLGEGGYGPVYKGELPIGQEIAVKRLSKMSKQGLEEFKNEVMLTAKLQHVNLVRLLGFCTQREEKMLIYEYMPNKSLDFYLFDLDKRLLLDWKKRVQIIEGVTQGLLYLQEYSRLTILHRDLKASNILLDNEMRPKISDLGMARIFDEREPNSKRIVGTYGYVPPECVKEGAYSMKSDVYSFGVLLLQIISGKKNTIYGSNKNMTLLEYGYELWKDGKGMELMDPSLDDASSSCKLMTCMQVALLCVQERPADRLSMLEVYSMLKNETSAFTMPKRPAFSLNRDEDEEKNPTLQLAVCSNDATISQVLPR